MPKSFFLYGANPSELAQSQGRYEQLYTNAAEGNRSAAAQAAQVSLSAFLQAQAADDQARQFDARNRMALFSDERQRGDQMRHENENLRRFNLDFGQRQQDRRQAADFNTRFGIPREQAELDRIKAETAKAKREPVSSSETAAMANFRHKIISDAIDAGLIENADDVMKIAPGVNPDQARMYAEAGKQVKFQIAMEQGQSPAPTPSFFNQAGSMPNIVPNAGGISTPVVAPPPMFQEEQFTLSQPSQTPSFFSQPRTATATNSAVKIDRATAAKILAEAGGDPVLARQLAAQRGYAF